MILRLKIYFIVFLLVFVTLWARLFYWQIIKGGNLSQKAKLQYQAKELLSAPRGSILSSDRTWLAANTQGWLMYASKLEITESLKSIANKITPLLRDRNIQIEELLNRKNLVWIPLVHKLKSDVKNNIQALNINGIGFEPEDLRVYPESSSAAQLLGFVGKDDLGQDKGYFGLEGYYDLQLTGKEGFALAEKDAHGVTLVDGDKKTISAISGVDLLTYIDKTIQLVIEKRLKEGIEKYGAISGTAVVLDPNSVGVLAMASYPSYDPEKYFDYGNEFFKNPVISDSFEPGSIFKTIVMASGLDAGVIEPNTKCDICGGPVKVDKYSIETWDNKYHPDSTMTDVIVHSDNVGMTFVGRKLGAGLLYDYLTKFGIGELSGVDLQGEENSGLRGKGSWNDVDLATASFGQGVAVTPIQMVRAAAVIANGGNLVKPKVVAKITKDGWEENIDKEQEERVISTGAAEKMTNMMVAAVKNGEAKWTQAKGFKIAGKTGTAQIPIGGHYDDKKTIASFVGFAPADKPKFVMLVTLREPKTSPWGSETAAPLWFSIARDLFPYLGIQPEN